MTKIKLGESPMKPEYKREDLKLTKFDTEDVITTSGISPESVVQNKERENAYDLFSSFDCTPGSWF